MKTRLLYKAINLVNRILHPLDFHISRRFPVEGGYISARETIHAASQTNQTICEYVESLWQEQGLSQQVVENFKNFGALNSSTKHVCEIGTGTGCYAEKILRESQIISYESYELDQDWAQWLSQTFNIISHPTDGDNLKETPPHSIDLIHANGVFVYTKFLITYKYFLEIFRVTRYGGFAAFDIFSEECFDEDTLNLWLMSEHRYPCILPKLYVKNLFIEHEFSYIGEFFKKLGEGKSLYLIFQKKIVS